MGQREDFRLLLGGGHAGFLPPKFGGLLFEVPQLKQGIVPAPLQRARDQALRGIDLQIAPLGERRFVLGAFDPHLPLTQQGLIA